MGGNDGLRAVGMGVLECIGRDRFKSLRENR